MAKKKHANNSPEAAKIMADQSARIAEWTAQVLAVAEQLRLKSKVVDTFKPGKLERTVLSVLHTVTPRVRSKMKKGGTEFTATEGDRRRNVGKRTSFMSVCVCLMALTAGGRPS